MRDGTFDVLVVGGGVVGSGIARDAASRGFRTALVERGDFASGTSGKTSRLVHGGLRYLQRFKIGLVRSAVRERDLLVERAPGLVHPLPFLIPAYRDRGLGPALLRFALFVYDVLSRKKLPRRAWLRPDGIREREPGLRSQGLAGAGVYYDAWTDDARFVLAVVQDAAASGAAIANYVEVEDLVRTGERVTGARVHDRLGENSFEIQATVIVNATGVWLDRLRAPRPVPTIRPTKGIHIFLRRSKLGNRHALALTTRRDHRIVFVLPWGDLSLVGTTDTDFQGDLDRVTPNAGDVAYLIEALNDAFPEASVGPEDVVSAYAGLRPLVRRGRGGRESDVSRDHAIFVDSDGLLSIAGGKLTTHRAMAEAVVSLVAARLGRPGSSRTKGRSLGPPVHPLQEYLDLGFDKDAALHLQGRHTPEQLRGTLEGASARERIVADRPSVWAQVDLAVSGEMAMTVTDVLVRRLGLFYEASDQAFDVAPRIASRMAGRLGWDNHRIAREVEEYRALVLAHRAFRVDHGG